MVEKIIRKPIIEWETFLYESLQESSARGFLKENKKPLGINMYLSSGKAVMTLCGERGFADRYFRSSTFPVIFHPLFSAAHKDWDGFWVQPHVAFCFPFSLDCRINVLEEITKQLMHREGEVYLQLLLKKQPSSWQKKAKALYEDYLSGISSPSSTGWVNHLQHKVHDFIRETLGERHHQPFPEFDLRLLEEGFQFSLRVIVKHPDRQQRLKLSRQLQGILGLLSAYNRWEWKAIIGKRAFLRSMQEQNFPFGFNPYQILTESELLPFFLSTDSVKVGVADVREGITLKPIDVLPSTESKEIDVPFFNLLPTDSVDIEIGEEQLSRVRKAFRKLGLKGRTEIEFVKLQSGSLLQKITFQLPQGLKLSSIEKEKRNLEAELGTTVEIGKGDEPGTAFLSFAKHERGVVWLKDIIMDPAFKQLIKDDDLPLIFGRTETGELLVTTLQKVKHLLTAGATGAGKSFFLNCIITSLMMLRSPRDVRLLLIDPKKVEFSIYKNSVHVEQLETDPQKAIELLVNLTREMDSRYEKFAELGVRDLDSYNRKVSEPLPRLVCIIDEFADLIMLNKMVEEPIIRLGQLARASGIHIILATQRPSVDVVTGLIKTNLPSRVVFMCSSTHDYKTCLDGKPPTLLGKGDAVAQLEGEQDRMIRFQGAVVTFDDEELEKIVHSTNGKWSNQKGASLKWEDSITVHGHSVEEDLLYKMKQYITETGETRVTAFQKHFRVRKGKITELVKELVTEGWLREPEVNGKPYTLGKTKEEMIKGLKGEN